MNSTLCFTALSLLLLASVAVAQPPKTAMELGFMDGFPPKRVVDMSMWDKGEDCRWAFQHISEIIPVTNVSRGSTPPLQFERSLIDLSSVVFTAPGDKEMAIKEMIDMTFTDGFIVLKDGKILFEKYYNGMTPHSRHLLMSVSKSVTGTIAGLLVNEGLLNPDKKVIDYIPELKNSPGFADATVREVLDMTTSIVFSEDYDDPEAEVQLHEQATAWRGRTPVAEMGLYAFAQTIKKDDREHGEKFHYASINTDVLGWLIQRAARERLADYMSVNVWSRIGAEHDAHLSVDYHGSPVVNGGFVITLPDLARFAQMVLDDGFYNGQQIIPSGWIDDIRFNGKNSAWKPTKYAELWPEGFYRNHWYVTNDDHGSFFAIGVNGQNIWINPTTRVVIVKFSSTPVSADMDKALLTWRAMDALARWLGEN